VRSRSGHSCLMSISPRTFSTIESTTETSNADNAPLVAVPWSKFGARRLYIDTPDGQHVGWVDLNTGHRSLAMPELAPAFMTAVSEAEDASTPRRALDQAIEFALIAGHDSLHASEPAVADALQAQPAASVADDHHLDDLVTMRRAYRGKQAFSDWEVGARGKRLVAEELDQHVSSGPRMAYLNSISDGHITEVSHLFA
jgi:hypothetical protein